MLAKLTSKNQLTIPADLLRQIPATDYFEATVEDGRIVLRPVRITPAVDLDQVRDRLEEAGLDEGDVRDAVTWARRSE